jgi:hypothetical protein
MLLSAETWPGLDLERLLRSLDTCVLSTGVLIRSEKLSRVGGTGCLDHILVITVHHFIQFGVRGFVQVVLYPRHL